MANKHMKRHSASLFIWEMQSQTPETYPCTPVGLAKTKEAGRQNVDEDIGHREISHTPWGRGGEMSAPFWGII